MNKKLILVLKGASSAIDIFPESNFQRFIPKGSDEERLRANWERTGEQLRTAMKEYEQNRKKEA